MRSRSRRPSRKGSCSRLPRSSLLLPSRAPSLEPLPKWLLFSRLEPRSKLFLLQGHMFLSRMSPLPSVLLPRRVLLPSSLVFHSIESALPRWLLLSRHKPHPRYVTRINVLAPTNVRNRWKYGRLPSPRFKTSVVLLRFVLTSPSDNTVADDFRFPARCLP